MGSAAAKPLARADPPRALGLYHKNWVTYAQGPPAGIEGPEALLKYLTRYVSGVAISDKRLVSHAAGRVVFRWKNYRAGGA